MPKIYSVERPSRISVVLAVVPPQIGVVQRCMDINGFAIEPRADLAGANLAGADLTRANLTDADLTNANLTGANLTKANLAGANLTGADLTVANLTRTNFKGATMPDRSKHG